MVTSVVFCPHYYGIKAIGRAEPGQGISQPCHLTWLPWCSTITGNHQLLFNTNFDSTHVGHDIYFLVGLKFQQRRPKPEYLGLSSL